MTESAINLSQGVFRLVSKEISARPLTVQGSIPADLNGDGRIYCTEFSQLIQRLQRLRQGEERLLLYLMPLDTNGNDRLDPEELARLLTSIGQPALTSKKQALVFMNQGQSLSWHEFVDRLLLS